MENTSIRITDALIMSMISDPKYNTVFRLFGFPPKRPLNKPAAKGCGSCKWKKAKTAAGTSSYNMDAIRRGIVGMDAHNKQLLKTMLGASSLHIRIGTAGKVKDYTL